MREGFVTSGWCKRRFKVSYNTAFLDLNGLVKLDLLEQVGKGRGTRYVPKKRER
jgi:predicted HTH transcriptional regulator